MVFHIIEKSAVCVLLEKIPPLRLCWSSERKLFSRNDLLIELSAITQYALSALLIPVECLKQADSLTSLP